MYHIIRTFWQEHWASRFLLRPLMLCYLVLVFISLCFSNMMIFPAPRASYSDDQTILKLTTTDGVHISARYLPNARASYSLLYSHGNYEDLGDDADLLQGLHEDGFAVFAYDYHGYGTSEGKPSEGNSYRDIDAAYAYLTGTLHVPPAHIIIYGRSLGGGPSVALATRTQVAGLILQSTFTTPYRTVTHIALLPFDCYHNDRKIARVHCPVLLMQGTADHVVPFSHGLQLYAAARPPKQCLWVDGADHDNFVNIAGERYHAALANFKSLLDHR